jgi:hypothetical protein
VSHELDIIKSRDFGPKVRLTLSEPLFETWLYGPFFGCLTRGPTSISYGSCHTNNFDVRSWELGAAHWDLTVLSVDHESEFWNFI